MFQDYFVRVSPDGRAAASKKYLYICVVCWAKLSSLPEMHIHRETCKVNYAEDGADTLDSEEPTNVVCSAPSSTINSYM